MWSKSHISLALTFTFCQILISPYYDSYYHHAYKNEIQQTDFASPEIPEELPPSGHGSDDSNSDAEEVLEEENLDDYADDFEEYDSDEVTPKRTVLFYLFFSYEVMSLLRIWSVDIVRCWHLLNNFVLVDLHQNWNVMQYISAMHSTGCLFMTKPQQLQH